METNEKEEKITITYETPGIRRILSAHLFDWFISLILGFVLLIATFNIIPALPNYQNALNIRNGILLSSSLYVKKDDDIVQLLNLVSSDSTLTTNQKSEKIDESLTYFFLTYINEELENKGKETYLGLKAEAKKDDVKLFDEDGARIFVNVDYDATYYSFYSTCYREKALGFLAYKDGYLSSRHTIIWTMIISIFLTFLLSFLIFYLLVPLIFKKGKRTFGMLIMKTALVSKDAFSCKLGRFIFHALFEIIFIIIGSLLAFLIPLAISLTMIIMRKNDHQSLTDYVIGTYVVSTSQTKIYDNIYEYSVDQRKINESHIIEDNKIKLT